MNATGVVVVVCACARCAEGVVRVKSSRAAQQTVEKNSGLIERLI